MINDSDTTGHPVCPYADLDAYAELPRLADLRLSPGGTRLVVGVAMLDATKTRHISTLWEVDPNGVEPARRLTRSEKGESAAGFTPDGDLLFASNRPAPGATEDADAAALWVQPASGDAQVIADPPGGVHGVLVAPTGTVLFGSGLLPSAVDLAEDAALRTRRKDTKVSAILHEEYPIRHWDHDIGPDRTRLFVAEIGTGPSDAQLTPRDLTGHVGRALGDGSDWDLAPDGKTVVSTWIVPEVTAAQRFTLVAIDVATGARRILADDPGHEYESPRISPDGTQVAAVVRRRSTPKDAGDTWLAVFPVAGGPQRDLTSEWDRRPNAPRWTPDGTALILAADDNGRAPLWRVDIATGKPTRLTEDDAAYSDIALSPDGAWLYALRSAIGAPPAPIRLAMIEGAIPEPLPGPAEALGRIAPPPGRLTEITATASDGTALRAWLALPGGAGPGAPAPLLLWIHGGPVMSMNAWSWRWNPWLAVAKGYAVVLPDPALSTGYGRDFIQRGWADWGNEPFTDLMTLADVAADRSDIDADRTAAMGASFGGYMANWVAGHTDRFAAIVTHASDWMLADANESGDVAHEFTREMTWEDGDRNSPHHAVDQITTPMLVIHGDKDYRVPIHEGIRLWRDLLVRSADDNGVTPHKFLYFPDENHWILAPQHTKLWYETVFAFLDHHVHGKPWRRPEILG
ncbi:prolyl oligopeptidase family serine peptidase [Actinoalloteichus hymeniacidonis]|uniref:prolyl oligopeptidase family serine peptidase n=1 Tax=Actinoalloteichus hymeniacidonis TaxID=340345 RepID=UPI00085308E7|nr:prolyl oligopeptidase family serine peptidase [Actinoalloteichus hymeniacidonis]MBB5906964.1 dipeptidyl aminopeptidase/acylaminoacyl peptidase [Actinoalloteichus hymeniacidonis]